MIHPVVLASWHADQFTPGFLCYLPSNMHVWEAFAREAFRVLAAGYQHYSARTIIEVLRHHSALTQSGSPWKLDNDNTPYLARLFALMYPDHADFFEFREAKAVGRA